MLYQQSNSDHNKELTTYCNFTLSIPFLLCVKILFIIASHKFDTDHLVCIKLQQG